MMSNSFNKLTLLLLHIFYSVYSSSYLLYEERTDWMHGVVELIFIYNFRKGQVSSYSAIIKVELRE